MHFPTDTWPLPTTDWCLNTKDINPLFSLLPVFGYLALDFYFPVRAAVVGGVILASLEIIWEKWKHKKVSRFSLFNFWAITLFGIVSWEENNGLWFKLAPALISVVFGLVWRWKLKSKPLLYSMLEEMGRPLPPLTIWGKMEYRLAWAFTCYGLACIPFALWGSTGIWAAMKGFGALFFLIPVMFWEMRRMRREILQHRTLLNSEKFAQNPPSRLR